MNIAFTTLYRENSSGGEARVTFELAEAFARKNKVLLIRSGSSNRIWRKNPNLTHLEIKSFGNNDLAFPYLSVKNINYIFNHLSAFSPQVIHAHAPDPLSLTAQIWASLHHIPFFCTTHEMPTKRGDLGTKDISKTLAKIIDSKPLQKFFFNFFKNCDAMIAQNQAVKDDIRDFGYKGQIFIIPNGRNLTLYSQCKMVRLSDKRKRLIFIGWIASHKNQQFLIEMMKALPPDFELYLVGKPYGSQYQRDLLRLIQHHHLSNVKLVGQIPCEKVPDYLEKSHFFVSASKMEIQSLAVIEALASGTPVVGLSNETVDELVDDSVGKKLPAKASPQDLAQAVLKLSNLTQAEYEKLCRKARERVGKMDCTDVADQTEKAYRQIMRRKSKFNEKVARIEKSIDVFPDQPTRNFVLKYANRTLAKLKGGKGYQKLKVLSKKTRVPYLYLTIILLLTITGGATFNVVHWLGKLRKKKTSKKIIDD